MSSALRRGLLSIVGVTLACAGAPRPASETAPAIATASTSSDEALPHPAETTCAPLELIEGRWGAPSPQHAELIRASFEALARLEPAPAFASDDSPTIALARRLRACPTSYDGEYLTFDRPELREVPLERVWRSSPEGAGHDVLETRRADEALAARPSIEALRDWLNAHSGALVETVTTSYLRATSTRDAETTHLCLETHDEQTPLAGVTDGACWSITPAATRIDVLARVEPPYDDDEAEDATHQVRAFVRLDGVTHALRDGTLRPETVRSSETEQWTGPAESTRSDAVFTFAPLATWDGPALTQLHALEVRRRGDDTLVGEHLLCQRDDGAWACADPAAVARIGGIAQIDAIGDDLWVTARRSDDGHDTTETSTTLHLLTREDGVLVHRGSFAIAFEIDERAYDDEEGEEAFAGGLEESATWSWTSDRDCLTISGATSARRATFTSRGRRRAPDERTSGTIVYGAPVDHLPVYAPTGDPAGVTDGFTWIGEGGTNEAASAPVALQDRRGSWRLGASGWARTPSCAP